MTISPNQEETLAVEIRRIYEDAEIQLLKMIAKKVMEGQDVPNWAEMKLNQLSDLLRQARRVTGQLDSNIPKLLEQIIEMAYLAGNQSAMNDLKQALETIQSEEEPVPAQLQMYFPEEVPLSVAIDATMETFSGINTEAVRALAGAITGTLTSNHVPIVRAVDDIYRQIVTDVAGSVLTGAETRREASQRILNKFADKGVKVFRDRAGRNWEMATYSEMATRATIGQASLQGHINKMQEMGFDLIQVSDTFEECELCRPWEGKVLSVSGSDPDHKTLAEATAGGLFHPGCGHRANTYFEGLTKPIKHSENPDGYDDRQNQRYLERQIRHWRKRQAVAVTPEAKAKADAKVQEWRDKMSEFIDETGRRRKYEREQITKAR